MKSVHRRYCHKGGVIEICVIQFPHRRNGRGIVCCTCSIPNELWARFRVHSASTLLLDFRSELLLNTVPYTVPVISGASHAVTCWMHRLMIDAVALPILWSCHIWLPSSDFANETDASLEHDNFSSSNVSFAAWGMLLGNCMLCQCRHVYV